MGHQAVSVSQCCHASLPPQDWRGEACMCGVQRCACGVPRCASDSACAPVTVLLYICSNHRGDYCVRVSEVYVQEKLAVTCNLSRALDLLAASIIEVGMPSKTMLVDDNGNDECERTPSQTEHETKRRNEVRSPTCRENTPNYLHCSRVGKPCVGCGCV